MAESADLLQAVRQSWPKPLSLALGWALALATMIGGAAVLPLWVATLTALLVGLVITAEWIRQRRLGKCPSNCFGFVVAIHVDNEGVYPDFRKDFIQNLKGLLSQGKLKDNFWFYEVPQFHLGDGVDSEKAIAIRERTKSAFVLFGQVRTRSEDEVKHYLDLRGLVGHAETTESNKKRLTAEFSELLPRRLIASSKASLPAFEVTSSLSSVVAKYIAGIAAFVSGFSAHASVLYEEAQKEATNLARSHEVARKIVERIPLRFGELSLTEASKLYRSWRDTKNEDLLIQMEGHLDACHESMSLFPEWRTLKAISMVAASKNDFTKIELLLSNLPESDPVTQMNLAFLDVVNGRLRSATKHYRKAEDLGVLMETVEEVMSFLEWYEDFKSDSSYQINFALGFISYCILKDRTLTEQYFEKFNLLREGKNETESQLIEKWLSEIPASRSGVNT